MTKLAQPRVRSAFLFLSLLVTASIADAQPATRVIDLAPGGSLTGDNAPSSFPHGFMALPGKVIFRTGRKDADQFGVTDGTAVGTRLLPSVPPEGECFSPTPEIGTAGNLAFWLQCIDFDRGELWRSDGTPAGTFPLTSGNSPWINLPSQGSNDLPDDPAYAFVGGILYFQACLTDPGCLLWRTDGSLAGTRVVKAGEVADGPMMGVGNRLFFATHDDVHPILAVTDGTPAGTLHLKSFDSQYPPRRFAVAGGKLFFLAGDSVDKDELWVSDGTAAGTRAVSRFVPQEPFFGTNWLVSLGGRVYFTADDVEHGSELWVSDGTASGTVRITEFGFHAPFHESMRASHLAETTGGRVVFLATDDLQGYKLWATSGKPESTALLTTVCPDDCNDLDVGFNANIELLRAANGRVVFTRLGDGFQLEAWSTDGTAAGTFRLTDKVQTRPSALQGLIYFGAQGQLWVSDGTVAGTRAFSDLPTGSLPFRVAVTADQRDVGMIDGKVLFPATSFYYGNELWASTGQPGGTELLADLTHGSGVGSGPRELTALGDRILFVAATDNNTTFGLFSSGGTAETTVPLGVSGPVPGCGSGPGITGLLRAGARVYFSRPGTFCQSTLWSTDGTAAGTRALNVSPLEKVEFQSQLYFIPQSGSGVPRSLSKSDGTPEGTVKVFDFPAAATGARALTALGPDLYFYASDNEGRTQVWKSDGTLPGTRQLTSWEDDVTERSFVRAGAFVYFLGPESFFPTLWRTDGTPGGTIPLAEGTNPDDLPQDMIAFHGALYFFKDDVDGETVLYRSDGTPAGTVPVRSFPLDALGSFTAHYPVVLGDRLLFVVDDDTHGIELWQTDGTAGGTTLVRDIFPGITSSRPEELTLAGGRVFFRALDAIHGVELWQTDGTTAGTRRVQDINPELGSSSPTGFEALADRLFFNADDGVTGRELWVLPLATPPCQPSEANLCLSHGRFRVEAQWRIPTGNATGTGHAVPLSADTGYFWFFDPANVETILKVLDATTLNDHFWVFYGALSNVEYSLTVTDTETGLARRYFNPQGQFASVGDTHGFGPLGAYDQKFIAAPSPPPLISERVDPKAATGTCVPSSGRLCLSNGRFAVEASWKDFAGHTGTGTAVGLSGDTGYFWFFDAANVEAVLKVLDGTPVNGHFWVFYGALSNVEYTLTVTDTMTGTVKAYKNPLGRFASAGDVMAF